MKIITRKNSGVTLWTFPDDTPVSIQGAQTVCGNLVIADCNNSNSVLYENVTPPADWVGGKYIYTDGVWALNADWGSDLAKLEAEKAEEIKRQKLEECRALRALAYPPIGDQLDALFHAGVFPANMAAAIQSVKDKYPTPE